MPPSASPSAYAVLDARDGRVLDSRNADAAALPGSTVKPFVPARGVFPCRGSLMIAGRRFHCSHPRPLGPVNARDALVLSCNHYFGAAALQIPPLEMQKALRDFEPALATTDDERRLQALGHWGVSTTALRLARAYRRLLGTGVAQLLGSGKTGTTREAAWFAGWAPATDARVVVAVMTGGRGVIDARPAAEKLMAQWLR